MLEREQRRTFIILFYLRTRVSSGNVRPLRPGPRVPLALANRTRPTTTSTSTQAPTDVEENGKEEEPIDEQVPQVVEEVNKKKITYLLFLFFSY